jgi:hypothetical protein
MQPVKVDRFISLVKDAQLGVGGVTVQAQAAKVLILGVVGHWRKVLVGVAVL